MGIPENSVQSAIEQVCQIYSVPCFREQSRVLKVGNRLVFYGTWKDARGVLHSCGKADYLLTPQIVPAAPKPWLVTNPSWPGGTWDYIYNEARDVYEIKSDLGPKIGEIGPTMVAFALVRTNNFYRGIPEPPGINMPIQPATATVALWVEAKAGKERAAKPNRCMCGDTALDHQEHFRQYVTGAGAYHLIVRDSAEVLIQWFREHGTIVSK